MNVSIRKEGDSMSFEKYTQIYDGEPSGTTVKPLGKPFELHFDLTPEENKGNIR